MHKQCYLVKEVPGSLLTTTRWIPERFAVVGKQIRMKEDGKWDGGWVVKQVYGYAVHYEALPDYRLKGV